MVGPHPIPPPPRAHPPSWPFVLSGVGGGVCGGSPLSHEFQPPPTRTPLVMACAPGTMRAMQSASWCPDGTSCTACPRTHPVQTLWEPRYCSLLTNPCPPTPHSPLPCPPTPHSLAHPPPTPLPTHPPPTPLPTPPLPCPPTPPSLALSPTHVCRHNTVPFLCPHTRPAGPSHPHGHTCPYPPAPHRTPHPLAHALNLRMGGTSSWAAHQPLPTHPPLPTPLPCLPHTCADTTRSLPCVPTHARLVPRTLTDTRVLIPPHLTALPTP
jgi:hypothetical protein